MGSVELLVQCTVEEMGSKLAVYYSHWCPLWVLLTSHQALTAGAAAAAAERAMSKLQILMEIQR